MKLESDSLVTIIIPVHNQIGYLKSCLKSLKRAKGETTFDILVVDDKSGATSVKELGKLDGFRLIRNYENLGFLRTCNRAALNCSTEYILFLNSDTEVTDYWLDELINTFSSFRDAGLVGSKLVYPDNTLQECGGIVWKDGSAWNYGRNQDPTLPEYNYTKEADYVSGAAILIKRPFFLDCGLFDTQFTPAYYEDTDLAFRVRELGKKVYVEPKSVVIHHEGKSNGTDTKSGIKKFQIRNGRLFYNKWQHVLKAEHEDNAKNVICSRDRTITKKKILVIDHYVPTFDRDAGSRCMYMYLKLLVDLGLSVTFFPDNAFRDPVYVQYLERIGIEVLYGVYYRDNHEEWMSQNCSVFDYVLLSRPHISIKHIETVRAHSQASILFFGHDMHHVRLELEQRRNTNITDSAINEMKACEMQLWEKSDYLLYPSAEEVDILEQNNFSAKAIEVPIYFFEKDKCINRLPFEESEGLLFVANFNHPPNLDGLLWFVEEILPTIRNAIDSAKLTIVGSAVPDSIKAIESKNIRIESNLSDEELEKRYLTSKVSVVPLRFGAGVKGKVLESLYYKTPLVTTDFGAQGVPDIQKTAFVTNDPHEFANACIKRYMDIETWERANQMAHDVLFKKYSTEKAATILRELLKIEKV